MDAPNTTPSKPTVKYSGKATPFVGCAVLRPVDHPNHLAGHDASNEHPVRTSRVISWDEETGRIETQNTIYVPETAQ